MADGGAEMDVEQVQDRKSFVEFVAAMRNELLVGAKGWENVDLADFLEAMTAWAHDSHSPANPNPWRHAAALMWAGKLYE
ncbi:bsl4610 [Bradyrhizobium diazoefficiens USDA 110]|uniref:Bsl4610 protein n=3 Tax=Bradyrhizobium diazoefficiens TaxID=1355477 RepID=Q89LD5_BRADU|nr:hypothetical protein CO678_36490 [Bradyrhizobium diazoefficiens]QBP23384.1 hypothetical protein Bdiaspc4_24105 [Bradyrhizobium diazoefficiens]BAC49875.1 bsl4610 [Bradyrhizobium diazoefficiens USDA 110]